MLYHWIQQEFVPLLSYGWGCERLRFALQIKYAFTFRLNGQIYTILRRLSLPTIIEIVRLTKSPMWIIKHYITKDDTSKQAYTYMIILTGQHLPINHITMPSKGFYVWPMW